MQLCGAGRGHPERGLGAGRTAGRGRRAPPPAPRLPHPWRGAAGGGGRRQAGAAAAAEQVATATAAMKGGGAAGPGAEATAPARASRREP